LKESTESYGEAGGSEYEEVGESHLLFINRLQDEVLDEISLSEAFQADITLFKIKYGEHAISIREYALLNAVDVELQMEIDFLSHGVWYFRISSPNFFRITPTVLPGS
jgi:hypothetical protein